MPLSAPGRNRAENLDDRDREEYFHLPEHAEEDRLLLSCVRSLTHLSLKQALPASTGSFNPTDAYGE
jgi:hypothetical protein